MSKATTKKLAEFARKLLALGQTYPEAAVTHPWGETALGVRGKNFLFLREENGVVSFSVKLPHSANQALALPFTAPTGYGLGRHGWITCTLDDIPKDFEAQCHSWLRESYMAVAPKSLSKTIS